MPTVPPIDDDQKAALATQLTTDGVPSDLHETIFASFDAAGLSVVDKTTGDAIVLTDTAQSEHYLVQGMQGVVLRGIKLGDGQFLAWRETPDPAGGAPVASAMVYIDKGADLPLVET